jgi:3'-5' exoribonuclease
MSKQMVTELQPNQSVSSYFAVTERSLQPFKNKPGSFLNLVLSDRSGSVSARAWDNAEALGEVCVPGAVVVVEGRVEEYRGKLQLIIEDAAVCPEGDYDRSDLVECTKKDVAELLGQLLDYLAQVESPHLRELLERFFGDEGFLGRFMEAPGAKALHHSHVGGLLDHTVSVARILCTVADLHPELNRDLLIAGALLHDVGKLGELMVDTSINYTDTGRLIGHIVLTDRWVRAQINTIDGFPAELDNTLNHLLLSHHGQKEYGAPIVPMTAEACALHYADNLDAHVQFFVQAIEQGEASGNSWTEYQRLFDRYLYIGSPRSQELTGD